MSNTGASRPTLWRRSVSESKSNHFNSTTNRRGNPRIYIPSERAESNPNISGFIDSVQGVTEVQSQNLYGSEPSTDRTLEGGNMKLVQAPPGNVLQIRNQNLYGSESSIDCLYGGDNPYSSTLFQNRITEF